MAILLLYFIPLCGYLRDRDLSCKLYVLRLGYLCMRFVENSDFLNLVTLIKVQT